MSERKPDYSPREELDLLHATNSVNSSDTIEQLAAYAHAAWAGWTKYLFSKCTNSSIEDGALVIPASLVKRWQGQIDNDYVDLSEAEKASDRKEAMIMYTIVNARES